jgi:multicomponent Na+:H+ antiporter subunit G
MPDILNILQTIITIALLLIGTLLLLTAAIGIVRMPDLYTRMSAASKASSLGAICILLGVGVGMADAGVTVRVIAGIAFLLITTPVAAHMIGRAAYMLGVPLWHGAQVDELRGHYDRRRHTLSAGDVRPLPDSDTPVAEELLR